MKLPTLYKQTNTGAIQEWTVSAETRIGQMDDEEYAPEWGMVITVYGQVGGQMQTTSDVITSGKNKGKKNETTPYEQAVAQARQQWDKKKKAGYTEDLELAKSTDNVLEGVKPMLAHVYEDHVKKVIWPAYAQPKLDGMRCIAVIKGGDVKLFTRTQKPIHTVPHIVAALKKKFENTATDVVLDGELYNHELKDDFNKLMSILKRDELHPEHTKAQYHIYDIATPDFSFDERLNALFDLFSPEWPRLVWSDWPIHIVDTVRLLNEDELQKYLSESLNEGYEGVMYRNPRSEYEGKRSSGLLKVKTFKDAEFEVVGVEEGNGKLMGRAGAIWCLTPDGKRFKAKMRGALEGLEEIWLKKENYIGKKLTVKYQNLTPDGIPRFPVGIRFRKDE